MFASATCRYTGGIITRLIPHDLVVLPEPSQNRLVDMLPNAGWYPFVKATPACHATAAAEFVREVLRRREHRYVASAAFRRSSMTRKVSCDKPPQVFWKKCSGHDISPSKNTNAISVPGLSLRTSVIDPERTLPPYGMNNLGGFLYFILS